MQRLIGELMEFRRVETGHYTPRYVLVNVTELISTIADNFNEVNEQRRIDLRIDFPAQEVILVSDQGHWRKSSTTWFPMPINIRPQADTSASRCVRRPAVRP